MQIDSEHSALGRWILKKLFKIDIDDLASEQRASLALLDAASKHKTQFDAAVTAKEAQISDLLQQIEASKADLSYAAREIDQLKQDHEAKQHALDSLESEKANLQSKNDHLEALIKELEITIKQREAELAEALVCLTQLVVLAGVEQYALRRRRLAGVDVGHNAYVACVV